jgi:hypothetical protein
MIFEALLQRIEAASCLGLLASASTGYAQTVATSIQEPVMTSHVRYSNAVAVAPLVTAGTLQSAPSASASRNQRWSTFDAVLLTRAGRTLKP